MVVVVVESSLTSEPDERLRVFCHSLFETLCTSKTCQENYTPIMDNTKLL